MSLLYLILKRQSVLFYPELDWRLFGYYNLSQSGSEASSGWMQRGARAWRRDIESVKSNSGRKRAPDNDIREVIILVSSFWVFV